jgi:hypothetical protein
MALADKLETVRDAARELRALEQERADLEARLKEVNHAIADIRHQRLPQLFFEAEVDQIGVPARGNQPAFDAIIKTDYKAAIATSWAPEKRANAFDVLDELGLSYLIKSTYTVNFPGKAREAALAFEAMLDKQGIDFSSKLDVHHASLTAALKELCNKGEVPSPSQLEAIGGYIGNTVELKVRKEQ